MIEIESKLVLEQTRNLTLLYVEDDDSLRDATADIFRKFFCVVDLACNGYEGLEQYKSYHNENGKFYDIVITDIRLPVKDGIAMALQIRTILWNQIIVMASAFSDTDYFLDILNLGVDGFIVKPMDYQKMMNTLFKAGKKMQDRRIGMAYCSGNESRVVELEEDNKVYKEQIKKLKIQLGRLLSGAIDTKFEEIETVPQEAQVIPIHVKKSLKETRVIPQEEQKMLRQSFTRKTSAVDYVNDIGGDVLDEIRDLSSLDEEWKDDLCVIDREPTVENINIFVDNVLGHYTHAINALVEFTSLGYALSSLGIALKINAQKILENETSFKRMILLLEHLGYDLASWREHIFELQDTEDIHYLDSSFFSSCMQIEGIISEKEIEADDDSDFELF